MKVEELDSIVARLDSIYQNKKHIKIAEAQAKIDAINSCALAYYDGLYDMAKEVAKLLHKEERK